MNKTQLKAFQSIVGNFSPYFSKINNESMFLDSDLSGDTDRNRQVSIFNIDAKATDLLLTIKGFDQVENNLFRGQVFLKSDENTEILISEPCYYLNKSKVRFAIFSLIKQLVRHRSKIVFSSLSHLNLVVAFISTFFPRRKFVARETFIRANTSDYKVKKKEKGQLYRKFKF